MPDFPVLETSRLILREFRPSDASAVFESFSNPDVTRYINLETMTSIEEAENLVATRAKLFSDGNGIRWAVILKPDIDTAVGSCGFYYLNMGSKSCEVGYDLNPHHWRKGIMTEAIKAAISFAYGDDFFFPVNRISALTFEANIASIRVLTKLGFKKEGVLRECAYFKNAFHDLLCLSLIKREWLP